MADVVTVAGAISPDELGITMCHVHLLNHLTVAEQKGDAALVGASERLLRDSPVSMDLLGVVRRHHLEVCSTDNHLIGDIDVAIAETMLFKRMGGASMVEATPVGVGRDPVGLRKISGATGVNIICVAGWYINACHPAYIAASSTAELAAMMVRELTVEIGSTGVRAGVLKATLSSAAPEIPFTGNEEKVLRAAARAQAETGAAMTMHPCHHYGRARHYHAYLDMIKAEGGNLERCFLSHMEFWAADFDYQKSLLERGVYLAFDQFGGEEYVRPGWPKPSDQARVAAVVKLVQAGYGDRIMLSNEVVCKTRLRKYGGYGYAHVLENIVPDLRYWGVSEKQINTMLVENPKKVLLF
ncbi:MAG: phosphotriesterase-related protein [Chloroflexota bacterium]